MEYATQMDAARKGIYTKELLAVAEDEKFDKDELIKLVAEGKVIIPANKNHKCLKPSGIGTKLRTKINVNLGTSRDWTDLDMEMEKVKSAVDMGAEAIMDLSSCGDTQVFRRKLTSECPSPHLHLLQTIVSEPLPLVSEVTMRERSYIRI